MCLQLAAVAAVETMLVAVVEVVQLHMASTR